MQFTQSISYPGTVDEVVAMYLTPAYLERRFGQFVVEGSQTVSVEGQRVSFAGTVRPELIPAAAARFVKSDLRVSFTEEWARGEAGATSRIGSRIVGAWLPTMLVARVSWTRSPRWGGSFFVDVDGIAVLVQHAVALHVLVPSVGPAGNW